MKFEARRPDFQENSPLAAAQDSIRLSERFSMQTIGSGNGESRGTICGTSSHAVAHGRYLTEITIIIYISRFTSHV